MKVGSPDSKKREILALGFKSACRWLWVPQLANPNKQLSLKRLKTIRLQKFHFSWHLWKNMYGRRFIGWTLGEWNRSNRKNDSTDKRWCRATGKARWSIFDDDSNFLEPTPRDLPANHFYSNMLRNTEQGTSSNQMWQMNPRYENLWSWL